MSAKEIVTLQVGHYSNFIGAHWWNIQESSFVYSQADLQGPREICHDVLFREGKTKLNEVTYTPRLVAFDLKGSLRSLKQEGSLYGTGQDGGEIRWRGDITLHKEEATPANLLNQLDLDSARVTDSSHSQEDEEKSEDIESAEKKKKAQSTDEGVEKSEVASSDHGSNVEVWSDFLRTHYHPRSVQIVNEYSHKDELCHFDLFNSSGDILSRYENMCEWEDRIHHFTEECDYLQGFHVLMDTHDGFGGLGTELLKYLQEEFPRKGLLTFGFTPTDAPDETAVARASRIINSALVFDKTCEHSSLFVPASLASSVWRSLGAPVKFKNISYNTSAYHTSAILASALDTLSLPYRLESESMHVQDITGALNNQGRSVATLNAALPLGMGVDQSLLEFLADNNESYPWTSLSPNANQDGSVLVQSVVLRGLNDARVGEKLETKKLPHHLSGCRTRHEALVNYLHDKCRGNPFAVTCMETPLKTSMPYPHIFDERLSKTGDMTVHPRPGTVAVESIPVMTSLQSGTGCGDMVESLRAAAAKMNLKKHTRYLEQGLEEDEYSEVLNNLEKLASNYSTGTHPL